MILFHYWRGTGALLVRYSRAWEGVLQKAVGLCVCQCHVFSGSRFKANRKDKGGQGGELVHC